MIRKLFSRKRLLLFFLILLIPSLTFAETQIYQEYKDYTIERGDTLWDISQKELQDPFFWPKVWKENPEIKHPDRIYPNQKIKIPLYLLQKELPPEKPKPKAVKKPKILEKPAEEIVEPKEIEYLVDRNSLFRSGFIADSVPEIGKITDSLTDRLNLSKDDYAYIKTNNPVTIGEKFYIIKSVKKIEHPKTGRKVGYLIMILGIGEVVENSNDPKILITDSFFEIPIGSLLADYFEIELPLVVENPRKPDINGYVVTSRGLHLVSGMHDIVYIDKGRKDGVELGDLLEVTTLQWTHDIPIGQIQIIYLTDSTATALVKKSNREIMMGDKIKKVKEE
jgi:LysM repeat protein